MGEHGSTSFSVWSSINVQIPEQDKEEIDKEVRKLGFDIVNGQGFTAYGVAAALLRITRDILNDEQEILPVSTYLKEHDIYISTPSKIGKEGCIENNLYTNFTEYEKQEFDKSVKKIKYMFEQETNNK